MEKGSLILDPTGLLPVEPEWVDPRDQRSMVIMTNVLSLWFPTSRVSFLRFQLVLPDLLLNVFVGNTRRINKTRKNLGSRVRKKSQYNVSNREVRLLMFQKRLVLWRTFTEIDFNIIVLHMADAFDRIYPLLFLRDCVCLSSKSAQCERRPPK